MLFRSLIQIAKYNTKISLHISSNPIPHIEIEKAILSSDFGLLPYQPNLSIDGKWPTKIFEYMANKLPIIIQNNSTWDEYILKNNAGISIDFINPQNIDLPSLLKKEFYVLPLSDNVYWSSEEIKLKSAILKICEK